ncbi:MAG: PAS domain-containing protein [Desulfomonilaceae bacterium]|nr:PAS domain-containing protein [Desulfomonilaceae bacterium]
MESKDKSRTGLTDEPGSLREPHSGLEAERLSEATSGSTSEIHGNTTIPVDFFRELDPIAPVRRAGFESTESIELKSLLTRDVTSSGSFDVRSGIWATTFGKVVQALPIPTLLVEESLRVTVANQACGRLAPAYEKIQGKPFVSLLGGPSSVEQAESMLKQVFSDRKPRVAEGTLRIDNSPVWARLTFRPIRITRERYVLVLIEDLTREKVQLRVNESLRLELEDRVERRTAQLRKANEELTKEVAERERAQQEKEKVIMELMKALAQVKKLSGLLPICASCKKIRDDKGYWRQIEAYIRDHSEAEFSHGICPECARKLYPEFVKD